MSNITTLPNEEPRPEMDDVLHDYFQAEMPHPWPAFQMPKPARAKQSESLWSRYAGRVALAASIALLVAGYLAVAAYFPSAPGAKGMDAVIPNIARKDQGPRSNQLPERTKPIKNDADRAK